MSSLTRLLYPFPARRSLGSIVAWWERRRPAYNLVVGAAGILTLGAITSLSLLPPDPRGFAVPVVGVAIYAVLANLCYTLGWMVEVAAHLTWGDEVRPSGPLLFRQGLIFSVGLTLLPIGLAALDWAFRLLRCVW